MKVLPEPITDRPEINLRLGIKSSLPKIKEFLSTYIVFYLVSGEIDTLEYSIPSDNKIVIKTELLEDLNNFFSYQLNESGIENIESYINKSPFFESQLEALQVGLELYFKLGKITFVDENLSNSTERSGGTRYPKKLYFSINANILKNILSNHDNEIDNYAKNILFNWITNKFLDTNINLETKMMETFTILSEEAQIKISPIVCQQESIYKKIMDGNTVESRGDSEPKGSLRIMKNFVSKSLHSYIQDRDSEFSLKNSESLENLRRYKNKVSTYLDLITRKTIIEIDSCETEENEYEDSENTTSKNIIYFGSPGTGKSNTVDKITKNKKVRKTTFHPEYDYLNFVGGYKPSMDKDNNIIYTFVPQIFTNIYIEAWQNLDDDYYLQIEEINRGNCAEIFGDLFQLLDRQGNGESKYSIDVDEELKKYLISKLGKGHEGIADGKIKLPSNLHIIATMNTSDQSLFPMDSAFKRRWDWEYMPINYNCDKSNFIIKLNNGNIYEWLHFLKTVNKIILEITGSPDKQMGNWFINATNSNKIIDEKTFINKVLFYLWNDVFKDEDESIFNIEGQIFTYEDFFVKNENSTLIVKMFDEHLKLINKTEI